MDIEKPTSSSSQQVYLLQKQIDLDAAGEFAARLEYPIHFRYQDPSASQKYAPAFLNQHFDLLLTHDDAPRNARDVLQQIVTRNTRDAQLVLRADSIKVDVPVGDQTLKSATFSFSVALAVGLSVFLFREINSKASSSKL